MAIPYKNKLKIIDLQGNLLREITLKPVNGVARHVELMSDERAVFMVRYFDKKVGRPVFSVRDFNQPEKELAVSEIGGGVTLSPYNKNHIISDDGPSIYNTLSKTYTRLHHLLPDGRASKVTLYNRTPYVHLVPLK